MNIACNKCGTFCEIEEAKTKGHWYAWCDTCDGYATFDTVPMEEALQEQADELYEAIGD